MITVSFHYPRVDLEAGTVPQLSINEVSADINSVVEGQPTLAVPDGSFDDPYYQFDLDPGVARQFAHELISTADALEADRMRFELQQRRHRSPEGSRYA